MRKYRVNIVGKVVKRHGLEVGDIISVEDEDILVSDSTLLGVMITCPDGQRCTLFADEIAEIIDQSVVEREIGIF